jgi:hypothetical protein
MSEDEIALMIELCGDNLTYNPWDCLNNLSSEDVGYWDYTEPPFVVSIFR